MALKTRPAHVDSGGVSLWVRDPEAPAPAMPTAADPAPLFSDWVRVPGLGSITMPDGAVEETTEIGLDGTLTTGDTDSVGSIGSEVRWLSHHPAHQFLAAKADSGGKILVRVTRQGEKLFDVAAGATAEAAGVNADAGASLVTFQGAAVPLAGGDLLPGHFIALGAVDPADGVAFADRDNAFNAFDLANSDAANFTCVVSVEYDPANVAASCQVSPGFAGAVALARVWARAPGKVDPTISALVAQFSHGTPNQGGRFSATLQIQPDTNIGPTDPLLLELDN